MMLKNKKFKMLLNFYFTVHKKAKMQRFIIKQINNRSFEIYFLNGEVVPILSEPQHRRNCRNTFSLHSLFTILQTVVPEPPLANQLPHGPCSSSCYFTENYFILCVKHLLFIMNALCVR